MCNPSLFTTTITDSSSTYAKNIVWQPQLGSGANVLDLTALSYNASTADNLLICITAKAPCNVASTMFGPPGVLTYSVQESSGHACCPHSQSGPMPPSVSSPPPPLVPLPDVTPPPSSVSSPPPPSQ